MGAGGPFDSVVRYKGTFDYHGLYNLMKSFFEGHEYDWYETRYKDKGNEVEVDWKAEREYDEIHKFIFNISWHIWDFENVETVNHGKRKTVIRGRMELKISSQNKESYGDIYDEKNKFQKWLMEMNKKIMSREKDEYWDAIPLVMQHDFINEVKAFLGMRAS